MRARGHEVIGVCAEGPLLDGPRAEGFRIEALPLERSVSLLAHWRAFRALVRLFRAERPDLVHAHMPISGFLARLAAWSAGVPRIAYTGHGFCSTSPAPGRARAVGLRDGMAWRPGHRRVPDRSARRGARREAAAHPSRRRSRSATAATRRVSSPIRRARRGSARRSACRTDRVVVLAVSRLVLAQGLSGTGRCDARRAGGGAVGGRRAAATPIAATDMAALLRDAGLGERLRLLGYREDVPALLAAADIFVLPSHFEGLPMSVIEAMLTGLPVVATRHARPARAGGAGGDRPAGAAGDSVAPLAAALRAAGRPTRRCVRAWARRAASARWNSTTRAKVLARTLDLLGL